MQMCVVEANIVGLLNCGLRTAMLEDLVVVYPAMLKMFQGKLGLMNAFVYACASLLPSMI